MLPLADIRVVALEQAVAAPLATRHLADLGADVVKIERPDGGDFARGYDTVVRGLSSNFAWLNRGKRSVALDLKDAAGVFAARQLAAGADVFVQNLGPGAAQRLGLGATALRRENPRLIYCSLSGYGETGPYAHRKAYDALIQGETGASSVSGTEEEPSKIGISVVDISGGMYLLASVLAALHERDRTGVGNEIAVSLFDGICEWMGVPLLTTKYGGEFKRSGLFHNYIAPYGPFHCGVDRSGRERTINIAVQNEREWVRLCESVLQRPDLAVDPRFVPNEQRYRNRVALGEIIECAFEEQGFEAAVAALEAAGIAFGEQREAAALQHHEQLAARDRWLTVPSEAGEIELLRSPFDNVSGWATPAAAIPSLGQDTAAVLTAAGIAIPDSSQRR